MPVILIVVLFQSLPLVKEREFLGLKLVAYGKIEIILQNHGDIIFFDWADSNDGQADHVGIVEKVENGNVYTIEGNTKGDVCKQNQYNVGSSVILGYGTPAYQ